MKSRYRITCRARFTVFVFAVLLASFAGHLKDLNLPYFWDEAGYFVPAARDLFTSGALVPFSIAPNAHPPLVMATLAAAWHLFGFSVSVARLTMLVWSVIGLLGVYKLGELLGGFRVGLASTLCVFFYPVFFAQSALAQLDMPAAAMVVWGLFLYGRGKLLPCGLVLSAAVLCKESAAVAAGVLILFEAQRVFRGKARLSLRFATGIAAPLVVLTFWLLYVSARTGHVFGNAEFARFNVGVANLAPQRLLVALLHRAWDVSGHFFLFLLTVPAFVCWIWRPRLPRPANVRDTRQVVVLTIFCWIIVFSMLGGAVLARYMLAPVLLVIVLSVYELSTHWRHWGVYIPAVLAIFAIGLDVPPPYHYAYDENLAYRDFVRVHLEAAAVLASGHGAVITTWPATDELSKPFLGYLRSPLPVIGLVDLSPEPVRKAIAQCRDCAVLFFPTQYEPSESALRPGKLLRRFQFWRKSQQLFETRPSALSAADLAQATGAKIVWNSRSGPIHAAILRVTPEAGASSAADAR